MEKKGVDLNPLRPRSENTKVGVWIEFRYVPRKATGNDVRSELTHALEYGSVFLSTTSPWYSTPVWQFMVESGNSKSSITSTRFISSSNCLFCSRTSRRRVTNLLPTTAGAMVSPQHQLHPIHPQRSTTSNHEIQTNPPPLPAPIPQLGHQTHHHHPPPPSRPIRSPKLLLGPPFRRDPANNPHNLLPPLPYDQHSPFRSLPCHA